MSTHIINQIIPKITPNVTPNGVLSSFLLGVGLSYCVETEKYSHIPLVLLFPTPYLGYHIFKNKDIIEQNLKKRIYEKK